MKKYLILIILIFLFSPSSYAIDGGLNNYAESGPLDVIFRSVIPEKEYSDDDFDQDDEDVDTTNSSKDKNSENKQNFVPAEPKIFYDDERTYQEVDKNNMPFFKQMRLRLSNKILENQYKNADKANKKTRNLKFWDKKTQQVQQVDNQIPSDSELTKEIESETSSQLSEKTLSLEGSIQKEETEKQMYLDSENLNYDDETGDVVATGHPILEIPPQKIRVVADKMTYNETSNILKATGNVIVYRDGIPSLGSYLEINMNEETVVMDDVSSEASEMKLTSEQGIQKDGLLIFTNGMISSDKKSVTRIETRYSGPKFQDMIVDKDLNSLFFGNPNGDKLTLNIKNIKIEARKNHDKISAEKIRVYRGNKYLFTWPGMTVFTDKQRTYFEGSYPELGTRRKIGMFIGPGFVLGGPNGSVIKLIPFLNYKNKFGIGGIVRYVNTYNTTEVGYGSANNVFFLKGRQVLDDNLFLQYSMNSYSDEWFIGARMAKYMVEASYDKQYELPNFLGEKRNLSFRHRIGFGFMKDDNTNYNGEHISSSEMSTTRTRYMAELSQNLYSYVNKKKKINVSANFIMQGSAALYGTGDTQFIGRMGPNLHIQYKRWMQDINYYLTGYDDHTPMPIYDSYRYGTQSINLTEAFRINKYLSVGWSGYINLSNDSPNGKMFQENAFLVAVGPDDLKFIFGYDFVREATYVGLTAAFNPKGTNINFQKMIIKNPERLGKQNISEEEERSKQLAFVKAQQRPEVPASQRSLFGSKNVKPKPEILKYAQIIEIEDPDKETIE